MIPKKVYITFAVWDNNHMCEFIGFGEEHIDYKQAYGDNDAQTIEYIDLFQVWHDADEEPAYDNWTIICQDEGGRCWVEYRLNAQLLHKNWNEYAECEMVYRWAYIADLLPRDTFSSEKSE